MTGSRRTSLSHPTLVISVAAVLAVSLAGLFPIHNDDTFGHLAQGRQIAGLGHVPTVDTFSFFEAEPQAWNNYEWGSDLLFWLVWDGAGPGGLLALKLLLLAATAVFLLARAAEERRARELTVVLTAALLLLAIPAARFRFTMRPELFGYALGALYLFGFERLLNGHLSERRRWGWIVGLFIAHIAWVNLHGSHLLGVGLAVAHLVPAIREPAPRRDLTIIMGSFAVASCISPYGPAIVTDAIAHVADPVYRQLIREWGPWTVTDPLPYLILPMLQTLLLAIAAIPLTRAGASGRAALLTSGLLAILAFRSVRFIALYALLSAPLLSVGLSRLSLALLRRRAEPFAYAFCVIAGLSMGFLARDLPPGQPVAGGVDDSRMPASAGAFLEAHVPGARVLAPMQTSWYLMFAAPTARFLLDGRVPFYGPEHVIAVNHALGIPGQLAPALERWGVDTVVLQFSSSETQVALATLVTTPGFYPVSIEDEYVLYLAALPGRERTITDYAFTSLPAALDPHPLLAPNAPVERMVEELDRLAGSDRSRAIFSWYRGILGLRTFSRGPGAGFRIPADEAEWAVAALAAEDLGIAAGHYRRIPVVPAYRALAELAACRGDAVREATAAARLEGGNREAALAEVEMALRSGDPSPARELLAGAEENPALREDPWLLAIAGDLEAGVRCP